MRNKFRTRVRIISLVIGLVALVLLVRLVDLQLLDGAQYKEKGEGQYARENTDHFDRGSILFTDKDGSHIGAASLATGFTLVMVPNAIEKPEVAYNLLSEIYETDKDDFMEKASKENDPHEELSRRVPLDIGYSIREAEIPGIRVFRERWRVYPGGEVAAHTVGFIGYGEGGDSLSGQYGLERFYDTELIKPNTGLYVNFFAELFANIRNTLFLSDDRPGANVVTSIEPNVQTFVEGLLDEYQVAWDPTDAGIIILEPNTGKVLAIAARPTFDPNDLADANPNAFQNPLTQKVYEFGSIFKPLTMAAGLDAGAVTPETTYNDKGYAIYDGSRISNFDGKGRGVVPMQEVLNQSLNTGAAYVVEKMGTDVFREYFDKYGLREGTGIDLPNEASPLTSNLDSPRMIEYATASFGQGVAVTPIAMARALGTLANHGKVPSPHIATHLQYPGGIKKDLAWTPEKRVLSPETAETISRMLVEVVDTALRNGTVKVPELSVAAKTGTAQIARKDARGYYEDRFLHSFFGYFPAYDPQFLVFLYAVGPQGARYASETWTDPFMESVHFLSTYYDIVPDRAVTESSQP